MTISEIQFDKPLLESVYDTENYSQAAFDAELASVELATEIERQWIDKVELKPYESDTQILQDVDAGRLVRVGAGVGYIARQYLRDWTLERSDANHSFHYSPPFVLPKVKEYIEELSQEWQNEMGSSRNLSVTSLVRSDPYQRSLASQERKLTIVQDGQISSHQVGLAFDIDGCGIVEETDNGELLPINPRSPYYKHAVVHESRIVLRHLLSKEMYDDRINFVEELPGTQQHCFHIALNPLQF